VQASASAAPVAASAALAERGVRGIRRLLMGEGGGRVMIAG
jgi:hypothetical protein